MPLRLSQQSIVAEGAWVAAGDSFLVARDARQEWGKLGPVLPLILGIYDRLGNDSLRVLRHRIYTNAPLTNFDRSAVRVIAKSCSFVEGSLPLVDGQGAVDVSPHSLCDPAADVTDSHKGLSLSHGEALQFAQDLADKIPRQDERYLSSRAVAAVLTDPTGQLIGAAINTNRINRARHAEVNLILNWWVRERRPIPAGSVLYVTLSPCQMCAELIGLMANDSYHLPVIAAELDPGRHGRHHILTNLSVQP